MTSPKMYRCEGGRHVTDQELLQEARQQIKKLQQVRRNLLAALKDLVEGVNNPDRMAGILVTKAEKAIYKAEGRK